MSVIYMVHSQHGAKVAISDAEANYDEAHGWTRYNPATPTPAADVMTDDPAPADAVANALAAPRRRGRTRQQQEP